MNGRYADVTDVAYGPRGAESGKVRGIFIAWRMAAITSAHPALTV
jgi:hypothetical protein